MHLMTTVVSFNPLVILLTPAPIIMIGMMTAIMPRIISIISNQMWTLP